MSRTGSTTSLPSSQPGSSDGAASFQDERLSDYTTGDCPTPRADVIELDDDPDADTFWVDWDGPDDPENPQNWSYPHKWGATLVVSSFAFISPVASAMIAPATAQVSAEFDITSSVLAALVTSIFLLGYVIGPLFLGPLSEIYGRSRVLQVSNLFFLAWNIGCAFAQNANQLIVFRFLSGIGGSAPLSVGGGVVGDIWRAEQRGKAMAIYSLAPLLGPVVGPICGAWITQRSTWRWVFWSTSIIDVLIQSCGYFFLQESFAPYLLEQKANKIRKSMDLEKEPYKSIRTIYETSDGRSWKRIFSKALVRPFQLFYYEPIIQVMGTYLAFIYGIYYLFLNMIPDIYADIYHNTPGIGGLHYIALGVGITGASQINARLLDRIYVHLKNKNGGTGQAEYRLPSMVPASILLPIGLFLAGWSAQKHLHWIITDIGLACIGAGVIVSSQAIQTYVIDSFTLHAASALAVTTCLRSVAGFGFPLFAPVMFAKLGYGNGNTLLACLAIVLGCPAPILLLKYGRRIRMSSRYADKPREVEDQIHQTISEDSQPITTITVEIPTEKPTKEGGHAQPGDGEKGKSKQGFGI